MMKDEIRDRLIKLLSQKGFGVEGATIAADHLIAHGVTFGEDTNVPTKDVPDINFGKWISVNERFPEKSGFYLVAHKNGFISHRLYHEGCDDSFGTLTDNPVTHWMPLPSLPEDVE